MAVVPKVNLSVPKVIVPAVELEIVPSFANAISAPVPELTIFKTAPEQVTPVPQFCASFKMLEVSTISPCVSVPEEASVARAPDWVRVWVIAFIVKARERFKTLPVLVGEEAAVQV